MNEVKFLQLMDEIQRIPGAMNGYDATQPNIPKVYLRDNPLIKSLLDDLNPQTYRFSDIFDTENTTSKTFQPEELRIKSKYEDFFAENPYFCFTNEWSKKFLAYCGKVVRPTYIWELIDNKAPIKAAAPVEGEGGAEEAPPEDEGMF